MKSKLLFTLCNSLFKTMKVHQKKSHSQECLGISMVEVITFLIFKILIIL